MATKRTPSTRYGGLYWYLNAKKQRRWGAVVDLGRDWETSDRVQQRKEGFPTQEKALTWQTERREARRTGSVVVASDQPLGEYLRGWLESREGELRPSTVYAYRRVVKRVADLHGVPLSRLRASMLERCYQRLRAAGYRPSTIRITHGVLVKALADAVRLDRLVSSPASVARVPPVEIEERTTLSLDQVRRLREHSAPDERWGVLWALITETWLRIGEVQELRWGDVDLEAGTLSVRRTRTRALDGGSAAGPPKSKKGTRTIPLSPELLVDLRRRRVQHLEALLADGLGRELEGRPVFPGSAHGGVLAPRTINDALRRACVAAGVPVVTVHEIRHSGASMAHSAGADVVSMSKRLGHANVNVTLGIYVHKGEEDHRRLSDDIARLLAPRTSDEASA